ncbi:hypothetical protein, partial [Litoribaculum gwangyangense]|uniref:hypothetical protein n=1 Tax=Litoribaculum gwangyangense TaxID=1130722 RepID=UPI0031ECFC51
MKVQLLNPTLKFKYLLSFLFIFFSLQSYSNTLCGTIEGFEFTNGHESVSLVDSGLYAVSDLPGKFYINTKVKGASQSVKYIVENLDTGKKYSIIENRLPYTFPAGNAAWNLGEGRFKLTAILYKFDFGLGHCESKSIIFTLGNETCSADAGTLTADSETVVLANGSAMIS